MSKAPLPQEDYEEAQWHFMEKSCMETSQNKLMVGNLPRGWNHQKPTIARLRGLADQYCRAVTSNEVVGRGPKGEEVVFKLEDGKLHRYVDGVRFVGLDGPSGDHSDGVVKNLNYTAVGADKRKKAKKQQRQMTEAWVEDQEYGACSMSQQALYTLGSFAFQAGVKHNIPDEVQSLEIIHDADVGCHALIAYKKKLHAVLAIQGLRKSQIGGRTLLVSWAREEWPLWSTSSTDLAIYGIGFQLYFFFIRLFGCVTLLGLIVGFPLLIACMKGNALNALQDVATANAFISFLTNTTIANLGKLRNDTSVDPPILYREVKFGKGKEIDIRSITMLAALADAVIGLLLFILAFWFEHWHIPSVTKKFHDNVVNAEAWAVFVDYLPPWSEQDHTVDREKYARKLTEHFESILRARLEPRKVTVGQQVVKKTDRGSKKVRSCCALLRHVFLRNCGFAANERDLRGRIIGKVTQNNQKSRQCKVQWLDTGDGRKEQEVCSTDDLLDANLLNRLEQAGCGEDSHHRSECLIHEVSLVVDYAGQLAKLKQRYSQSLQRHNSKSTTLRTKNYKDRRKSVNPDVLARVKADLGLQNMKPRYQAVEGAFIIFSRAAHREFILREYRFSRTSLRSCCLKRRLRFMRNPIRVREAAPPGDIYWSNMDAPADVRLRRRIVVAISCVVLIVTVFAFCSYAKQAGASANEDNANACPPGPVTKDSSVDCQCNAAGYYNVYNDEPPGIYDFCEDWLHEKTLAQVTSTLSVAVILLVSMSANTVSEKLAKALHPDSLTTLEDVTFSISFILQTLILTLITAFVYWRIDGFDDIEVVGKGSYDSLTPEWYLVVGGPILFTLVVNMIYPYFGAFQVPWFFYKLYLCRHRKKTKEELLTLYTPPQFPFALRQAEQMCGFFTMLLFSSGMPLLYVFLPLYLFTFYWCDKYVLLRASNTPPMYGASIIKGVVGWLQIAVLLHAVAGVYFYGEPESSPSYCQDCEEAVSLGAIEVSQFHTNAIQWAGNTEQLTFFNKLQYTSTLPSFFLALFITCVYLSRLALYIVGESFASFWFLLTASRDPSGRASGFNLKRSPLVKPTSESQMLLSGPFTRAMHELNRLGKSSSYDISKAVGYEFLDSTSILNTGHPENPKGQPVPPPAAKPQPVAAQKKNVLQKKVDDQTKSLKDARHDTEASWPAAEDCDPEFEVVQVGGEDEETFDHVHPGTMEHYDNPTDLKEKGKHRATQVEALVKSNSIIGLEIDLGSILECQCEGFVYERGFVHLNAVIGMVSEGDVVEAAGPPEVEYGYLMVPIIPHGSVDMSVIMGDGVEAEAEGDSEGEEEESIAEPSASEIGVGTKLVCVSESGTDLFASFGSMSIIGKVNKGDAVEAAGTPIDTAGTMMLPLYPQGVAPLKCFQLAATVQAQKSLQPKAAADALQRGLSMASKKSATKSAKLKTSSKKPSA